MGRFPSSYRLSRKTGPGRCRRPDCFYLVTADQTSQRRPIHHREPRPVFPEWSRHDAILKRDGRAAAAIFAYRKAGVRFLRDIQAVRIPFRRDEYKVTGALIDDVCEVRAQGDARLSVDQLGFAIILD